MIGEAFLPPDAAAGWSLTPAEEKVRKAALSGGPLNLSPTNSIDMKSADWGADRRIRASWLIELLAGDERLNLHPSGLNLTGAQLTGSADWSDRRIIVPLRLSTCRFDERLLVARVDACDIALVDCALPELYAYRLQVKHDLQLAGCVVQRRSDLRATTVGGSVNCSRATFSNPSGEALSLSGAKITGNVFLDEGCEAAGTVNLDRATIGGDLICCGSTFNGCGQYALRFDSADISGNVSLRAGFTANGPVEGRGACIGGNLDCDDASFNNQDGVALGVNAGRIAGSLYLHNGFVANGAVCLVGVSVSGVVSCPDASFNNPGDDALRLDGAKVAEALSLGEGFNADGRVCLIRAQVGGMFSCRGGSFKNPTEDALRFDGAKIEGDVWLDGGFEANGRVMLAGATIGGLFGCHKGGFKNPDGEALNGSRAEIANGVYLSGEFSAEGSVDLSETTIGGLVGCSGGSFKNPGGEALTFNLARISGGAYFDAGFRADGAVNLPGVSIDGQLSFAGGTFCNSGGKAIDLEVAQVSGPLDWAYSVTGVVNLQGAAVGELRGGPTTGWPSKGELLLGNFTYSRLGGIADKDVAEDVKAWLTWVGLQPGFGPQPYEQLGSVYQAMGHEEQARQVRIAKFDDQRILGGLPRRSRAWRWFLGWTIKYGYKPGRAAAGIAILYVFSVLVVGLAHYERPHTFLPVRASASQISANPVHPPKYPTLSILSYPVDSIVPVVNLHQAEYWQPDAGTVLGQVVRDELYLATLLGWGATTLFVAALTGAARRD